MIKKAVLGVSGAMAFLGTANEVASLGKRCRSWYRAHFEWTVTVSADDQLYPRLMAWYTGTGDAAVRAVQARSLYQHNSEVRKLALYSDTEAARVIEIGEHRITVSVAKAGDTGDDSSPEKALVSMISRQEPDRMTFRCRSKAAQDAVLGMFAQMLKRPESDPVLAVYDAVSYDGWRLRGDVQRRSLASVVLVAGQRERIAADLDRFLDSEQTYADRALPWHRGYLFHGPPGTGKTSLARALADEFGLSLHYLPLGDLKSDGQIAAAMQGIKPRSILLLEDIDVFHAATQRQDGDGPSMAGLLNALDGVLSPHGLITVMTTNDLDNLDPAIVRAGRVDLAEKIDLPDADQAVRLWAQFYGRPVPDVEALGAVLDPGLSTAGLSEIFKRHMDDPAAGWQAAFLTAPSAQHAPAA